MTTFYVIKNNIEFKILKQKKVEDSPLYNSNDIIFQGSKKECKCFINGYECADFRIRLIDTNYVKEHKEICTNEPSYSTMKELSDLLFSPNKYYCYFSIINQTFNVVKNKTDKYVLLYKGHYIYVMSFKEGFFYRIQEQEKSNIEFPFLRR